MKKRNMLTKVAALSMAGMLGITGLPVAGLDGAMSVLAADGDLNLDLTGTTYTVGTVATGQIKSHGVAATGSIAADNNAFYFVNSDDLAFIPFKAGDGITAGIKDKDDGDSTLTYNTAARSLQSDGVAVTATIDGKNAFQGADFSDTKTSCTVDVESVTVGELTYDKDKVSATYNDETQTNGTVALNDEFVCSVVDAKSSDVVVPGNVIKTPGTYQIKVEPTDTGNFSDEYLSKSFTIKSKEQAAADKEKEEKDLNDSKNATIEEALKTEGNELEVKLNVRSDATVTYTPDKDGARLDYGTPDSDHKNLFNVTVGVYKTVNKEKVYVPGTVTTYADEATFKRNFYVTFDGNDSTNDNASITVKGKGGTPFEDQEDSADYKVEAKNINHGSVHVEADGWDFGQDFGTTGAAIEPKVIVYDDERTYGKDDAEYEDTDKAYEVDGVWFKKLDSADYTVSYENNDGSHDGDSAILTIEGTGNYAKKITRTDKEAFYVKKAKYDVADVIEDVELKVTNSKNKLVAVSDSESIPYRGKPYLPQIKGKIVNPKDKTTKSFMWDEKTAEGASNVYAIETNGLQAVVKDNKDAGTATVEIVGTTPTYGGTYSTTFTISGKELDSDSIASKYKLDKSGKNSTTKQIYDGTAQSFEEEKLQDWFASDMGEMTYGKDFTAEYTNNTEAGTATVTFVGTGNYTGAVSVDYQIEALKLTSATFKPDVDDVANQVYTGTEIKPTINASWINGAGKKAALVEGTDYTLEYRNNIGKDSGTSEGQIDMVGMGNFQATKKSVAKFKIVPSANNLANATVTLREDSVAYDGQFHTAAIKSVRMAGADKDLAVSEYKIKDNVTVKDAGEYTVTVIGQKGGSYGGEATAKFTVTPQALENPTVTLDGTTKFTYNGKKKTVKVASVTLDGTNAAPEGSYDVKGLSATAAGKKTVTVTFKGNFSGTAKATWTINKAANTLKVKKASYSYKANKKGKLAAKKTFTVKTEKAQGKVTLVGADSKSKKALKISGKKVTVKKGTKKGTYKVTVKAAGNSNYKAGSKTVTITVK